MTNRAGTSESTFESAGEALRRRRGALLLAGTLGVLLGLALDLVMPSVYRGRVRIEIRRAPGVPSSGVVSFQSEQVSMYTAAEQITSRALLARVAAELDGPGGLESNPGSSAAGALVDSARAALSRSVGQWFAGPRPAPGSDREQQVDRLLTMVSVQPVRDTRLVDIFVDHTDPEAAGRIAGRIGTLFQQTVANDEGGTATGPADARHDSAGAYEPVPAAFPVDRAGVQAKIRELNARLADLTGSRLRARGDRIDAAQRLGVLRRSATDSVRDWSQLPTDGSLGQLRRDLFDCEQRLAKTRETFGPRHPRLLEVQNECAALRAAAQRDLRRAIADQRAQVSALAAREEQLASDAETAQSELRRAIALDRTSVDRPEPLLAGVESPAPAPAVAVVDGPTVDPRPIRPRRVLNVLVCGAAGLLAGCALVLLRAAGGGGLRTPDEVEAELELPVLGVLPKFARIEGLR